MCVNASGARLAYRASTSAPTDMSRRIEHNSRNVDDLEHARVERVERLLADLEAIAERVERLLALRARPPLRIVEAGTDDSEHGSRERSSMEPERLGR